MEDISGYDAQGKPIWGMKMGKVQRPYHLQPYQKDTVREVKNCLAQNKYTSRQMVREHLDVIAGILGRIDWAVSNEDQAGYDNISSKNDIEDLKKVYYQLKGLLNA